MRSLQAFIVSAAVFLMAGSSPCQESKFDAKDARKTATWASLAWKPVTEASKIGNAIARQNAERKASAEFLKAKGQAVEWTGEVQAIQVDGFVFALTRPEGKEIDFYSVMHFSQADPRSPARPFAPPNAPWVEKAKIGDKIRVQGTIVGYSHGRDASDFSITFFLANVQLSPAKK